MGKECGIVKWFDEGKSYGFITPDLGGKDVFFYCSDLENTEETVEEGCRVEYEVGDGTEGPQAKQIRLSPME